MAVSCPHVPPAACEDISTVSTASIPRGTCRRLAMASEALERRPASARGNGAIPARGRRRHRRSCCRPLFFSIADPSLSLPADSSLPNGKIKGDAGGALPPRDSQGRGRVSSPQACGWGHISSPPQPWRPPLGAESDGGSRPRLSGSEHVGGAASFPAAAAARSMTAGGLFTAGFGIAWGRADHRSSPPQRSPSAISSLRHASLRPLLASSFMPDQEGMPTVWSSPSKEAR